MEDIPSERSITKITVASSQTKWTFSNEFSISTFLLNNIPRKGNTCERGPDRKFQLGLPTQYQETLTHTKIQANKLQHHPNREIYKRTTNPKHVSISKKTKPRSPRIIRDQQFGNFVFLGSRRESNRCGKDANNSDGARETRSEERIREP